MRLTFDPVWSWPVVAIAVVLLLATVALTYPKRVRHLPVPVRRVLIGLRIAAVVVLALALLRPAVERRTSDRKASAFEIVCDKSRSMNTPDGPNGQTRRAAVKALLEENNKLLKEFKDVDVDVEYYEFAEHLVRAEAPADVADGNETAIGATLTDLLAGAQGRRLAGVLMITDGAERTRGAGSPDPRDVARRFAQLRIPIYAVGLGGAGITNQGFDVAVEDLLVDPLGFEKKTVTVNAKVRIMGTPGKKLAVRVLVEDRTGKNRAEPGELKIPTVERGDRNSRTAVEINPAGTQQVVPVELSFVPPYAGEYKIAVDVVPLDGELKTTNNRQATIVKIQRGGINVAFFDRLRPEVKFIRLVNRSEKIQLDFQEMRSGNLSISQEAAADLFAPHRYDAYIIGDVAANLFGESQLKELARRVEQGAGLLLIGGFHSFGAGGYADSPLKDLIPVAMNPNERVSLNEIDSSQQYDVKLQMVPTKVGLDRFIMRLDTPEKNLERWRALPPLQGACRLRRKNDFVEVLAETPDRIPLLFAAESGRARVAAFAGDTTRLWYQRGFREEHQRFWRQMILWLSHKEQDSDEALWVNVDPRNFAPGRPVNINFGARDERGLPLPDVDFDVEVTGPDGMAKKVTPKTTGTDHSALFTGTETAGDYWIRARARRNGVFIPGEAWSRFIVDTRDLELDNPAADMGLLEEITRSTGGYVIAPEALDDFLKEKLESGLLNTESTTVETVRVWDNWAFLTLFVGLLSLEWFFRKRRGLV